MTIKKYAPVCPINVMTRLAYEGIAGDYHLVLAHDVVAHADQYEMTFQRIADQFPNGVTVILDNSVVELKKPVDPVMIKDAYRILNVDGVNVIPVLPDHYLDGPATVASSYDGFNKLIDLLPECEGYFALPQGKTRDEWRRCAVDLFREIGSAITWCGVPRNYQQNVGNRRDACDFLSLIDPSMPIHLFGFSDDVADDLIACAHPMVVGIDSAVPVRLASLDKELHVAMTDADIPPRGDWWDEAKFVPLMRKNINEVRFRINSDFRLFDEEDAKLFMRIVGTGNVTVLN